MAVHDDCKLKFLELKTKRAFRFIVFKIEEKQKQVIVEKLGEPAESYEDFCTHLPADECRYAVYDFEFLTKESVPKSRIFFIAWYCWMISFILSIIKNLSTFLAWSQSLKNCTSIAWSLECAYSLFIFVYVPCVLHRSPDTSKVRSKMIYASSKDRFKRELDGIQIELQATDPTEMGLDVFKSRAN